MQLGRAIRLARVKKGWTQDELARKLGVSTTYVSLLERDKRDPSWSFIQKLAKTVGVPLPLLLLLASDDEGTSRNSSLRSILANELLALAATRG